MVLLGGNAQSSAKSQQRVLTRCHSTVTAVSWALQPAAVAAPPSSMRASGAWMVPGAVDVQSFVCASTGAGGSWV